MRGACYFARNDEASTAIVVCLYNEEDHELRRTLESLAASGLVLDVVIIADGLEKLSASVGAYLLATFDLAADVLQETAEETLWAPSEQTFISLPTMLGQCRARVLLKRFNHKKVNSHEWFFMAHVPCTGCPYALTTDTGAIFRVGTVSALVCYLECHKDVVAVTGRQRVMSEAHQRVLGHTWPGRDSLLEWMLRCLQGFDFELDHAAGKAANCAAGLLPCLHGPAALFRYADIEGRVLEEYFVWGYAPPHALGLIGASPDATSASLLDIPSAAARRMRRPPVRRAWGAQVPTCRLPRIGSLRYSPSSIVASAPIASSTPHSSSRLSSLCARS